MSKVSRNPFSNGTEYEDWNERNCERCIKACKFKKETKDGQEYTKCRCSIQQDIFTGMVSNEPISQRTIDVCNMTDCPYRKEHYPARKRKPKKVEGMNDLFG